MIQGSELFFSLFNNLAVFIALVTVYGYLLRDFKESNRLRRMILMGGAFGLFAIGCMFARIPVFEGVIVDQRNAIIALSGAFGGPVSALVSASLAAAFRIHLGGGGALAGVVGVFLAAASGIVLNRFPGSFSSARKACASSVFSTLLILPEFLFVKDFHTGWALMKAMAVPYGLAIFSGIMLVGLLLNREKKEFAFEMVLKENQERLQKEILRRKAVEEELHQSRERLNLALSGANEGIWDWDIQKNVVYFDDRYYGIAGYSPNEFPGNFDEFAKRVHENDIKRIQTAIDRSLAGELEIYKTEFRFLRKNGTYMWIQAKGKIVSRDEQGKPLRFAGIHADITERKRMEEMMIQSEKMLSVGGLAAGMAHEINNPLAGMIQTAQVVTQRLRAGAGIPANLKAAEAAGISMESIEQFMEARNIHKMLGNITESGHRVSEIVTNMLSFARKDDAAVSSHYLNDILDKTIELSSTDYNLKKAYDFKQVKIIREYDANPPLVPCQSSKIQQVLLNILTNGAQAMQGAGTPDPVFIIRTYVDTAGNMACMEIEDNGPGIDDETRKHIFDPFFTTKPEGVGTGLGLSVSCFIITENHNGEMSVESSPGAGAKFIMRLPLSMDRD